MRTLILALSALLAACSPAGLLNATVPDGDVIVQRGTPYGDGPRRTLDVYRPRGAAGLPMVVFLYGGSWSSGSKDTYPFVARTLAARGAVVVVPDYRLYPEVTYPAFLQDNAAAVAWAVREAPALGADPARVFLLGHSAGAYNAAMLALDPQWLAGAGLGRSALRGVIALATPADFLPSRDPTVYPVFGAANDAAHQPLAFADGSNPPLLLLHGDADTTVEPRNTRTLATAIAAHGGAVQTRFYPGVGHIGIITAFAPLFRGRAPVLDDVWQFMQAEGRTERSRSPAP